MVTHISNCAANSLLEFDALQRANLPCNIDRACARRGHRERRVKSHAAAGGRGCWRSITAVFSVQQSLIPRYSIAHCRHHDCKDWHTKGRPHVSELREENGEREAREKHSRYTIRHTRLRSLSSIICTYHPASHCIYFETNNDVR